MIAKPTIVSMVCRTCEKWRKAEEYGLEKCLSTTGCGSPLVGDTFHDYQGPIQDFLRFCFVCGDKATKAVNVRGHARRIGVCNEHVEFVITMAPKTPKKLPVLPPSIMSDRGEIGVDRLRETAPKTLGNLIRKLDAEEEDKKA